MEIQELLAQLVSINSAFPGVPSDPDRPGEQQLAVFIEHLLKEAGFAVQRQYVTAERFNILAERGQGVRALLLSGHMDTVPAVAGWQTNPWEPQIDGDRLTGLGSCDMKGGLAAILQAVEDAQPQSYKLKLAFLVDEEHISWGAHTLVQSGWMSDVVAVLVPEIGTSGGGEQPGPQRMTLGRQGRVDLDIHVQGRSAHAGNAEAGVSALLRAAIVALALQRLPLAEHPQLGRSRATIRRFVSEAKGLSIPEVAELCIDRHLVPPETIESARQDVTDLIERLFQEGTLTPDPDLPITVSVPERPTPYLMPYVISPTEPFVQLVGQVVRDHLGLVSHHYAFSVADENYFGVTLGLPVIVLGPAGGNHHAPGEWVSISSLKQLVSIYRDILARFEQFETVA
ncbi:MAG TPA: M20/M25/M40 family metallo-hydrolase [Ktedonobacterales bacterium]|nr:M20/M25/M40 family metallo-hydrolase [Ktedonobacterales bacterium]